MRWPRLLWAKPAPSRAIPAETSETCRAKRNPQSRVSTLVDQTMRERHTVVWDGPDDAGNRVSSGVYMYRLRAGDFTATRKMVVLR